MPLKSYKTCAFLTKATQLQVMNVPHCQGCGGKLHVEAYQISIMKIADHGQLMQGWCMNIQRIATRLVWQYCHNSEELAVRDASQYDMRSMRSMRSISIVQISNVEIGGSCKEKIAHCNKINVSSERCKRSERCKNKSLIRIARVREDA